MRIANNLMAMNAHRQLMVNQGGVAKSIEKLSSGLRINRAGDDAAGLAISEKMRGQIRGLRQAMRNAQDGISLIQTAEGALNEVHAILQRMRELADQAANDTNTPTDRNEIQKEINQLTSEINRIGNTTEFNTQKLLRGDGRVNLAPTNIQSLPGSFSGGATTHTQATQTLEAADGVDADDLDGETLTVTLNGVALTVNFVVDESLSDTAALDADSVTGTSATIRAGGTVGEDALAAAIRGALTSIIGQNDTLAGNYEISDTDSGGRADNKVVITAVAQEAGGQFYGSKGNIATTEDMAAITGDGAASVGTTTYDQATHAIDFEDVDPADLVGKGFSIGDLQFEFYNANDGVYRGNAIGINISNAATDAELAQTLAEQLTGYGDFTATSDGTKVTLTATALGEDGNGLAVRDGGVQQKFRAALQIGANEGQSLTIEISDMRAAALGIAGQAGADGFTKDLTVTDGTSNHLQEAALDVSTHENAARAITIIDAAIERVSAERSNMGAVQNRLEHTIANLGTSAENLQAAESRIRDVDMAAEMMNFTKYQILQQAATAMLAQANLAPQSVLQLLG